MIRPALFFTAGLIALPLKMSNKKGMRFSVHPFLKPASPLLFGFRPFP
jgi:hypothetical protein